MSIPFFDSALPLQALMLKSYVDGRTVVKRGPVGLYSLGGIAKTLLERDSSVIIISGKHSSRWGQSWSFTNNDGHFVPSSSNWGRYFVSALATSREFYPVLYRYFSRANEIEETLATLALRSSRLAAAIQEIGIRAVILGTSSSHHLDSIELEVACRVTRTRMYFLSAIPPSQRLAVISQSMGPETRELARIQSDKLRADDDFDQIADGQYRRRFFNRSGYVRASFWLSFLNQCIISARLAAKRMLGSRYDSDSHAMRFHEEIRLLWTQKRAIRALDRLVRRDSSISVDKLAFDGRKVMNAVVIYSQVQPEASTLPEAGPHWSIIELAARTIQSVPLDQVFYKEHPYFLFFTEYGSPLRQGVYKSERFFSTLAEIGIRFMPWDPRKPDAHHSVPLFAVTISGTIAIERALMGLPTFVAGFPWYRPIPGCHGIDELSNVDVLKELYSDVAFRESLSGRAKLWLSDFYRSKTLGNPEGIGGGYAGPDSQFEDVDSSIEWYGRLIELISETEESGNSNNLNGSWS